MSFLSKTFNGSLRIIALLLAVMFVPGIPPHMEFEAFSVTPPLPLEGALAINSKLNDAEKLFVNELIGPEHMEVHNDVLYTTVEGGYVVKLVDDKVVPIVKFGKNCDGLYEQEICGRPLGLSFDNKGFMYAADAYYGVFKVNISSGEYDQLASMDTEIDGKVPKLPNSVAVAKDGTVYWTDSSTTHSLKDSLYILLGNGNGRLIKYDPKTKMNTVLVDKLHFANGVALSHDEAFVLVADLLRARILKYNLKGPKKGETEVFLDGLPGYPDNIHPDNKRGFYTTISLEIDNEDPGYAALLGPYPILRKFFARLIYLLEFPALQVNLYYPNYYTKLFAHWVGNFGMLPLFQLKRRTVIFFNEEGKITRSLHCTDGKIGPLSDFTIFKNNYYMGSFINPYLARVKAS